MAEVTASKTAPDKGNMPAQERLQERPSGAAPTGPTANILALHDQAGNQAVNELLRNGNGRPLDASVRAFMESRFNHDFSQVRVHTDAAAAQSAEAVSAKAYTVGNDIVFKSGMYTPETVIGRHLLAHELTHVIQQQPGKLPPPLDPSAAHEKTANSVADSIINVQKKIDVSDNTGIGLAKQGDGQLTPAHAGGEMGERDAAFALGQKGFNVIVGPGGPEGHKLTTKGFDIVAYNPKTDELKIVDNKSSGGTSTVQEATAITKNLGNNLKTTIDQVKSMPNFPEKNAVITKLEATLNAVENGKPIPSKVSLVITNAGGYHSGISKKLKQQGIQFEDITGKPTRNARKQDIKQAKAAGVQPGRSTTHQPAITPSSQTPKAPVPTTKMPAVHPPKPAATPKVTGDKSAVAPASKSPVTPKIPTAKIPSTPIAPKAPSPSAKAVTTHKPSSGVGYAAGEAVGQIINQIGGMLIQKYVMDVKNEEAFREKLESKQAEIEKRLSALEKEVVQIHADGKTAYLNITIKVRYQTGPVSPDGPALTAFMGLDLENVKVSAQNIRTESSPKEGMARSFMKEMFGQSETLLTYSVDLPIEPYLSKVKEKQEKIRQQQKEKEELQKLLEKQQKNAPKPTPPPQPPQGAPTLTPSFTPSTSPSLLPGAPPMEGPIEQAARFVKATESWAAEIEKQGTRLADRIHSNKQPKPHERQSYLDAERTWRLYVKRSIEEFRKQSRLEAVNKLEELLDRMGPKLHQFRIYFGGD